MALKGVDSLLNKRSFSALGITPKSLIGPGLMAGFGIMDYQANRDEGYGVVTSAVKTGSEFAIMDILGMKKYIGLQIATELPKAGVKAYESMTKQARSMSKMSNAAPFQNAVFNDTQQAYTMRQAGMQMAQASKYNLQQTLLGNEAQYLHR